MSGVSEVLVVAIGVVGEVVVIMGIMVVALVVVIVVVIIFVESVVVADLGVGKCSNFCTCLTRPSSSLGQPHSLNVSRL